MNTLRLKLFQETACYKKPAAFKVGETYPLPPFSTVKGMLHQVLRADRYIPMKLSIQGNYESRIVDYQRHYFFESDKNIAFPLVLDGLALDYHLPGLTTMPLYMHMLLNVNLVIHIQAEDNILEQLHYALHVDGAPISLGRWEDLVRVDECKYVEVQPNLDDGMETVMPIYIADSLVEEISGVPYRLNWKYTVIQGVRQWSKIKVKYVPEGELIEEANIYVDQDGYPVAIPLEMEE
jgi:CRISPR-associated protein Cas5t